MGSLFSRIWKKNENYDDIEKNMNSNKQIVKKKKKMQPKNQKEVFI